MITDPIADMLTRIRNASLRANQHALVDHSKLKEAIAKTLLDEGFIDGYETVESAKNSKFKQLKISLRYGEEKEPLIRSIKRISRPGRRVRMGYEKMKQVLNKQGILIVSTSKGIISDNHCRSLKVGGEILCEVY